MSPSPPPASPTPFQLPLRVYWEDTDAGGVVFYANYLKFFERARTEWLRALGVEQQALRDSTGAMFIVSETTVRYLAPARLDDLLGVTVSLQHAGRASMTLFQQAWKLHDDPAASPSTVRPTSPTAPLLLAEGSIRIGCVNAGTFRPCRIPTPVLAALPAANHTATPTPP